MYQNNEDIIQHHGVLGMKWGVRKARTPSTTVRVRKPVSVRKKKSGVDEMALEKARIDTYRNRDKMSTRKLRALKDRMQVESDLEKLVYAKERARLEKTKAEAEAKRQKRIKIAKTSIAILSKLPYEQLITVDPDAYAGGKNDPMYIKDSKTALNIANNLKTGLGLVDSGLKAYTSDGTSGKKKKQSVNLSGEDTLLHGTKWSEEAKERVRQARRAGRSVYDMFSRFYNKIMKPRKPIRSDPKIAPPTKKIIFKDLNKKSDLEMRKEERRQNALARRNTLLNQNSSGSSGRGRGSGSGGRSGSAKSMPKSAPNNRLSNDLENRRKLDESLKREMDVTQKYNDVLAEARREKKLRSILEKRLIAAEDQIRVDRSKRNLNVGQTKYVHRKKLKKPRS